MGDKKIPFGYCNKVNKAYIKCVGGMLVKKAIEYLAYLVKHPTLDLCLRLNCLWLCLRLRS